MTCGDIEAMFFLLEQIVSLLKIISSKEYNHARQEELQKVEASSEEGSR